MSPHKLKSLLSCMEERRNSNIAIKHGFVNRHLTHCLQRGECFQTLRLNKKIEDIFASMKVHAYISLTCICNFFICSFHQIVLQTPGNEQMCSELSCPIPMKVTIKPYAKLASSPTKQFPVHNNTGYYFIPNAKCRPES